MEIKEWVTHEQQQGGEMFEQLIGGTIKYGFWAYGFFVVPSEENCYYRGMENEWRVISYGN